MRPGKALTHTPLKRTSPMPSTCPLVQPYQRTAPKRKTSLESKEPHSTPIRAYRAARTARCAWSTSVSSTLKNHRFIPFGLPDWWLGYGPEGSGYGRIIKMQRMPRRTRWPASASTCAVTGRAGSQFLHRLAPHATNENSNDYHLRYNSLPRLGDHKKELEIWIY